MKKRILELVLDKHGEAKEKLSYIFDMLDTFSGKCMLDDINKVLEFFYKHIPVHFHLEEILIDELKRNCSLSGSEKQILDKILDEHRLLRNNFQNIKDLAEKIDKNSKGKKEEFKKIVIDTLELFGKHADFEDNSFFNMASKLSESQFEKIKKKISDVVR